jgi:hypothetical protein
MNQSWRVSWGILLLLAVAMLWSCQQENVLEPDVADVEGAVLAGKGPPPGKGPKPKLSVVASVGGDFDMVLWEFGVWYDVPDDPKCCISLLYDDYDPCCAAYQTEYPDAEECACRRRDRSFSFWAEEYEDGTVGGEWQSGNRWERSPKPIKSHGKITCFTIDIEGNKAWIGGTEKTGVRPPDNQVVWRVQDNGTPADVSSLVCTHLPPGGDGWDEPLHECHDLNGVSASTYCAETPPEKPKTMLMVDEGGLEVVPPTS